jgi:hypothetical protein
MLVKSSGLSLKSIKGSNRSRVETDPLLENLYTDERKRTQIDAATS